MAQIQMVQQPELFHQPDQLVVDLDDLPVIQPYLTELGISCDRPIEMSTSLGLARLSALVDSFGEPLDVDTMLEVIRHHFLAERDLVPLMGTNRYVDSVIGVGHKPMAAGEPIPATAEDLPNLDVAATVGAGVRIGIVDTPLYQPDADHVGPVSIQAGHSIFVRSLISAQAPGASIHLNGALNGSTGRADSWDTATAMMQLADDDQIDILNLSLGSYAVGGPPLAISRAIEQLTPRVLIVAAAGNHGEFTLWKKGRNRDSVIWPAGHPQVIAVGADEGGADSVASFSPPGRWVTCTAQGVDVVGSYVDADVMLTSGPTPFPGFARWNGTSLAAATVTGAIAARTVPGTVTARQAFDQLLAEGTVVRRVAAAQ